MSISNLEVSIERVGLSGASQLDRSSSGRYSSVSLVGGFLYVVGKMYQYSHAQKMNSSLVGVLNVRERQWRWIPYPRTLYISPRIFLYEDTLLVFSVKDWVRSKSRKMSRFDLVLEQWLDLDTASTGAGPGPRIYFSGDFLEKGKLFVVFGGQTNGLRLDDVHILNVPEKRWVQPKIKGKKPEPRYMHGSCTHQGKIYYYGGWTRGRRCNDGLHVLTLANGNTATWSTLKQIDLELSSFALVSTGRLLVFCGGFSTGHHRTGLRVYDPVAGELREVLLEAATSAHMGYGSAAFKSPGANTICLFGGKGLLGYYVQLSVSE